MIGTIQIVLYSVIGSLGLGLVFLLLYSKSRRGKMLVFSFDKNRRLRRFFLRPTSQKIFELGDRKYIYTEETVFLTPHGLFKADTPAVVVVEGQPGAFNPVNIKSTAKLTDGELSTLLGEVAAASRELERESFGMKNLATYMLIAAVILTVGILGGVYYIQSGGLPT